MHLQRLSHNLISESIYFSQHINSTGVHFYEIKGGGMPTSFLLLRALFNLPRLSPHGRSSIPPVNMAREHGSSYHSSIDVVPIEMEFPTRAALMKENGKIKKVCVVIEYDSLVTDLCLTTQPTARSHRTVTQIYNLQVTCRYENSSIREET